MAASHKPTDDRNWRRWVPYYTGFVSAVGLSLLIPALLQSPNDKIGLLTFAVMAVLAELLSVDLFFRSRNSTVSVSGIVGLASIVALGPLAGVLIHLVTSIASVFQTALSKEKLAGERAIWFQRLAFNMGMWMIASAAAGGVYLATGGTIGSVRWESDIIPLICLAFTDLAVNLALLIGVIALQTGQPPLHIWKSDFQWSVPITLLGGILGSGMLALAYSLLGIGGIVMFSFPVLATGYSFRLYTRNTRSYIESLEALNIELKEADELKDGLLRNITHELKTPLAILSGYMELLRMDADTLEPEQQEMMEIAADQADNVTEIVRNVIAIYRGCQPDDEKGPIDIGEMAETLLQTAEMKTEKQQVTDTSRYHFSLQNMERPVMVWANREYLNRSFDAILSNAIKFSPNGGHIRVRFSQTPTPSGSSKEKAAEQKKITANSPQASWVQVEIQDEGIGIPASELQRVWEKFYQVDVSATRHFGGSGLGLSLVQQTVEAHGGTAWIESTVGHGTTVFFTLPLHKVDALDSPAVNSGV